MNRKMQLLILTALLWPAALVAGENDSATPDNSGERGALPDMKFRRLDTRDGLSNSQVNCILRDSRGYIWIGTAYGLNRYDGYRFKTFYSNKRDTTTMRDNYTDRIMEDWRGKLWLKQGMSYCVYDPVTERFERNVNREVEPFLGPHNSVEYVYIDGRKNLWIKFYEQGLYYYNPKTRKTVHFPLGYGINEFKNHYVISTMADMGNLAVVATNCGQLVCLNGERGIVEWEDTWMHDHDGPQNQDYKLFIDGQQNFWVTSYQHTYIWQRHDNRWFTSVPEALRALGIEGAPEQMEVWDVKLDSQGRIWGATDHLGLFLADPKTRQLRQYQSSKYDETTLSDNTPRHIIMDTGGRVWIGTYKNGVNQYQPGLASIRSLELGDVNTVTEDRYGRYWIGSNDRGIIVYDPRTGQQENYTTANSPLSGNIMVGSTTASDGSIWFGSYNGGLVHCVPTAGAQHPLIVNYRATGDSLGLANNSVWSVTEDHWHRIWIGTLGGGIQQLDVKTGKFRTWNVKNSGLPSDYLTSIGWIKKGWLLVGTSWYWCFVNPLTGKLANRMLPSDADVPQNQSNTVCVMEDSRGLIWQGSASGAAVFDQQTKRVWLLDMTRGLYGSSVTSIVEDQEHMMWVVTDHGVSKIVPEKTQDGGWQFIVRSYNNRDGLQQGIYNQRSAYLTHDGLLLIGGQDGLDIINPKALSSKKAKERPLFSGLQVFDADVPVGREVDGRVILEEALDRCRSITLRYNDQFTIQLASDAGNVDNGKRFVYRLEGFNDNWVKTSALNPNITYNSLRAGSYTLHVRMLNDDGTYGEEESTMDITIRPPLWRTRWMILLYMLLIAAAAWWWRRWFLARYRRRTQAEQLRHETEKKQWMSELRRQMEAESGQGGTTPDAEDEIERPLQLEPENLTEVMSAVCKEFATSDEGLRAKLTFRSMDDTLLVDIDREQISEAIRILLSNSVKFTPNDCQISVNLGRTDSGEAMIQVGDNGIGIRDEYKASAFEPVYGGEGIGLDRVRDIVVAHGGTIRLEDNPGGGTLFVITIKTTI